MPENTTTVLEKLPKDVMPEDLAKISDEDLTALHDSIHSMLLKGLIEEDEFTTLRDIVIQEMKNRGIRPLAEYSEEMQGLSTLERSVYREWQGTFIRLLEKAVGFKVVGDEKKHVKVCFDVDGFSQGVEEAVLALSSSYSQSDILSFSAKKDEGTLALFDAVLVPSGVRVMLHTAKPKGTPEDVEYFSSLPDATGQFFSAARSSSKKNCLEPSRFFRQARHVRGVHPEVAQSNDALMDIFADRQFPVYAVARYSNLDVQIHRNGRTVSIFSATGKNITSLLPGEVERLTSFVPHDKDLIILATLKFSQEDGSCAGTFFTEADLRGIAKSKDSKIKVRAMPYDCLYWGEDQHHSPWNKRMTPELMAFDSRSVKQINSLKHFIPVVNSFLNRKDVSGYMFFEQRPYSLGCFENQIIQVDKTFRFNAFVGCLEKTALSKVNNMGLLIEKGNLNFSRALDVFTHEMNLISIGSSVASSRWACHGDIVEVEATGLRHFYNLANGINCFEVHGARVVNRASHVSFPSSADTIINNAVEAGVYTLGLVKAGSVRYASSLGNGNPILHFLWEVRPSGIHYRVRDPGDFVEGSWGCLWIKKDKPRVRAIVGVPIGEKSSVIQALRFPSEDDWTLVAAKKWVAEHDFSQMFSKLVEDGMEPIDPNEVGELSRGRMPRGSR